MIANAADSTQSVALVHIGAGKGSELEAHLATGAGHVWLAEANPSLLPALESLATSRPMVSVVGAAIGPEVGEAELLVMSFSDLSSLAAPTGLNQLMPGIKVSARQTVPMISLDALLSQTGTGPLDLVIDAPGSEAMLIGELLAGQHLRRLRRLTLRCGAEPFYEGARPVSELVERVEDSGFRLTWQPPGEDLDWPELRFVPDPQVNALRASTAALNTTLDAERTSHGQTRTVLDDLRRAFDQSLSKTGQETKLLSEKIAELEQSLTTLRAELDEKSSTVAAADAEISRQNVTLAEMDASLQEAHAEVAVRGRLRAELEDQVADLATQLAQKQSVLVAAHQEVKVRGQLREEAEARVASLAEQRAEQLTALAKANEEAKVKGMQYEAQIADLATQLAQKQSVLVAAHQEVKVRGQLREEAEARCADLEARLKTNMTTLQAIEAKNEAARLAQSQRDADKEARLAAARDTADALAAELEQKKIRIEQQDKQVAELVAATGRAETTIGDLKEQIVELNRKNEKAEADRASLQDSERAAAQKAQADLGMGLRLQLLAQTDLSDLRTRYGELLSVKEQQDELLGKLTQRLREASQYLHLISPPSDGDASIAIQPKTTSKTRRVSTKKV